MKKDKLFKVLNSMTLEEKIGQLVQLTPDFFLEDGEITGPMQEWNMTKKQLFQIGSVLGTHTKEQVLTIQENYLKESRLKIPLVFMADVIHGYETIYPIPLALAATFDVSIIEEVAKLSAIEASQAGIHVTFSPMADHVMDSRWGRVLESNGEDVTLSKELTKAYVRGYQGSNLKEDKSRIASCVKHFIGYGASQSGRDYNTVDFSKIELHQNYLPAFKAAVDEGVAIVMTSFNTMNGVPVTGNKEMIQGILRNSLAFDGLVISDWAAVAELVAHRVAEDKKSAAKLAFEAGIEMDMMSDCYQNNLGDLIVSDEDRKNLDKAVFRVLELKNKLGLFEDPYRGLTELTEKKEEKTKKILQDSVKTVAEKTSVLLKNENQLLPLKKNQKVALIGPKVASKDILGAWSWIGDVEKAVSLEMGMSHKEVKLETLSTVDGAEISDEEIRAAQELARNNEVVILALGETSDESGEAASLANTHLSRRQEELIKLVADVNPNIVIVLFSGRPIVLTNVIDSVKSVLAVWFPGTRGGESIANLLMGEVNPSGKLPMSFPRSVGQLPLTYASLSTGRPKNEGNKDQKYISRYMDEENEALFPFGYGLSYSKFVLSRMTISQTNFSKDDEVIVTVCVTNDSDYHGDTIVQLYVTDKVAEIARPIKELKKWTRVTLKPRETKEVLFFINQTDLAYTHSNLTSSSDSGDFVLHLGLNSEELVESVEVTYRN